MRTTRWIVACVLGAFLLTGSLARAQGHGNGHGKGHGKHGDDDDQGEYYKDRDREAIRGWYNEHGSNLPPGLAKRDQLPPGLEKQLVRRGTLPPGLQKKLQPCPQDLERRLPPPPPHWPDVPVCGATVLVNRRTDVVGAS